MHLFCKLIASLSLVSVTCAAIADDTDETTPEISIIQERLFDKKREVGFSIGHLPDDNFYEAFPITVNFTTHFNERYAWEVIRASYFLNNERDIKKDLEENFGVTPSTFDELNSHIESSFIFKPTYGKDSLLNKYIINHEGYMSIGAGIATFEKQVSYGSPEKESVLTASFGIGRKYFVNKSFNISLDLRDIMMFKENNTENYIYFGIGFNYRFDLFGSMKKKTTENESIYNYL